MAISITVIVTAALAAMAKSVQMGSEYGHQAGTAAEHARVVLDRIERMVSQAHISQQFPGFLVIADRVASWRLPETLVVWHPSGDPAEPDGWPRAGELVLYCSHPEHPEQLVELTVPGDTRPVPPVEDEAGWRREVARIKSSRRRNLWVLTDRVRTVPVAGASRRGHRGAVRFEARLRPSADQWREYKDGTRPWDELDWVQGIYGSRTGLRQAWLRIELQLLASDPANTASAEPVVLPFFGSAARHYQMQR